MSNPKNPEPAVGQVWLMKDEATIVSLVETYGDNFYCGMSSHGKLTAPRENLGTYLGTLDELRARAQQGDLLRTDNSAVVARLSAENERLWAEVAKLKAE